MNTVFPAGSFKIQFRCHVFSEQVYNPSSWKRSLPSLNKWRLSTFPGLCSCPVLDYGCLFFRHVLLPLLEAKITSSSPLHAPRHRGNVHSADICAVALFFSTCHVLCRWIPQQSFPSFCLAAGYFRRSIPSHSQSLTFRAGGKPLHFYATPPTTLMGGIISIFQIWDSPEMADLGRKDLELKVTLCQGVGRTCLGTKTAWKKNKAEQFPEYGLCQPGAKFAPGLLSFISQLFSLILLKPVWVGFLPFVIERLLSDTFLIVLHHFPNIL